MPSLTDDDASMSDASTATAKPSTSASAFPELTPLRRSPPAPLEAPAPVAVRPSADNRLVCQNKRYLNVTDLCAMLCPGDPHSLWAAYRRSSVGHQFLSQMSTSAGMAPELLVCVGGDGKVWLHRYCAYHFAAHLPTAHV